MTIWPAMVAVTVEFSPQAQQRDAEERRRDRRAEQWTEQLVRRVEFDDFRVAAGMESRRGEDQDRRVDGKSEHQREGRVERRVADRLALLLDTMSVGARLDDA